MIFKGVVDPILDSGKNFNIDGRAGTGKYFMVNALIKELEDRNKIIMRLGTFIGPQL